VCTALDFVRENSCRPFRDSFLFPSHTPDLRPGLTNAAPAGAGMRQCHFTYSFETRARTYSALEFVFAHTLTRTHTYKVWTGKNRRAIFPALSMGTIASKEKSYRRAPFCRAKFAHPSGSARLKHSSAPTGFHVGCAGKILRTSFLDREKMPLTGADGTRRHWFDKIAIAGAPLAKSLHRSKLRGISLGGFG
jgi:hypothetical protein